MSSTISRSTEPSEASSACCRRLSTNGGPAVSWRSRHGGFTDMRIAAITPHQLLNNPRIIKEADALAAHGHDVRVIAVKKRPEQTALEQKALLGRPWRLQPIDVERT